MNTYTIVNGELAESTEPCIVLSSRRKWEVLALHSLCGCVACVELRKAVWYAADCPPPEVVRGMK